ncbi:MAG TPA: EVE domain-containing protein [Bacteroidota bacterium]|nr:EVE domain-containing protein [Bacteroidota bacterium]
MGHWLFKTEPGDYSLSDLEKEGTTIWSGVKNNLALKHLRTVERGDSVFIYHTGNEKAIVGTAGVVRASSSEASGSGAGNAEIELKFLQRLVRPVTLAELKTDREFADFDLLRNSRLSVMPVNTKRWNIILKKGSLT